MEFHPDLGVQDAPPTEPRDSKGYYRCRAQYGLVYKKQVYIMTIFICQG